LNCHLIGAVDAGPILAGHIHTSQRQGRPMKPVDPKTASAEVRAVFEGIKATRKVKSVNNFWRYLAHEPRKSACECVQSRSMINSRMQRDDSAT
jgi:hypothetical protein